jgi:hypothetical protein
MDANVTHTSTHVYTILRQLIRGHFIYLTNISSELDSGSLKIIHPDKIRRDAEKSLKNSKSDRDKF